MTKTRASSSNNSLFPGTLGERGGERGPAARPCNQRRVPTDMKTSIAAALFLCASLPLTGCQSGGAKPSHSKSRNAPYATGDGRAVEYAKPAVVVQQRPASSGKRGSSPAAQTGNTEDALNDCAERLHSLCGPLLFYYLQNRHFPATLQDLPSDGPEPLPPLLCPETHKPYVYALKNAIPIDNPRGYIIVHDAVPAHDGVRWCIVVSPGDSASDSLIVKSVGIREDRFAVLRTRALAEQKEMERKQQKEQPQQGQPAQKSK
jgi:hypothetical protein